jgi:tetratricopeptide (TPR) repeat protein
MKLFTNKAIYTIAIGVAFLFTTEIKAQVTVPAVSQEAEVTQRVGITDITIHYNRPTKRGRAIWGGLVQYGFNDLGFGTSKSAPWRAGADNNTTIEFTHDVKVEGKDVKAGKYALFFAPEEDGSALLILSSNTTSWGSYFYDQSEDVLRVGVQSKDVEQSRELLTYEFNSVEPTSTTATLHWDKKEIPFKIDVAVTDIVMAGIEDDLRNSKGFQQSTWDEAAGYAFRAGNMEKALEWTIASIEDNFFGKENFANLSLKAQILMQQGKKEEALASFEKAAPYATNNETFAIVNQLITADEKDKALSIAKNNAKKFKGVFPSNYILARGYASKGDFKNALKSAEASLKVAPEGFKTRLTGEIEKLKKGEDIN